MTITHQESSKKTKFQTKKSFQGPNCKMWIYIRTKYPGVPSSGLQDEMSQDTISQDEIWTQPWRNIIRVTKLRPRWVHITGKMEKSKIHWRYRYCKLNIEMDRIYNAIWKLEYNWSRKDHICHKTWSHKKKYEDTDERPTRHDLTRRNMKTQAKDQTDHAKTISVTRHDLTRRNMKIPMKDHKTWSHKKKYEDTDERPTWV